MTFMDRFYDTPSTFLAMCRLLWCTFQWKDIHGRWYRKKEVVVLVRGLLKKSVSYRLPTHLEGAPSGRKMRKPCSTDEGCHTIQLCVYPLCSAFLSADTKLGPSIKVWVRSLYTVEIRLIDPLNHELFDFSDPALAEIPNFGHRIEMLMYMVI